MASNGKVWTRNANVNRNVSTECLDAVRVLHQTIVCLRTALERSQSELLTLKSKVRSEAPNLKYSNTIEQLALENHVLRRRILSKKGRVGMENATNPISSNQTDPGSGDERNQRKTDDSKKKNEPPLSSDQMAPDEHEISSLHKSRTDSEESEEVDDIELIFTTDDTKTIGLQEELEPISDDSAELYESKSEVNEPEEEEPQLQPSVVTQSVLVETDISKCGIIGDSDTDGDVFLSPIKHYLNPSAQRHSLRSEQSFEKKVSKLSYTGKSAARRTQMQTQTLITRPISNDDYVTSVRDSEAQTDISAVPPHWKSESFLAGGKANQNFPTLPSKFAIPVKQPGQKGPLKLTDKTQEARRILLSDINFTSMVPELSRSVDHLCQNGLRLPNATTNAVHSPFASAAIKYLKSPALLSSGSSYSSKFEFNVTNSNWNCYENAYIPDQDRSTQDLLTKRRQSWRPSMFSLDTYCTNRTSSVPPSPTLRRHSAAISSYSGVGNADSQFYYPLPDKFTMKTASNVTLKNTSNTSVNRKPRTRVSFRESLFSKNSGSRQSLPNMYVDNESGEESTESLIDESEEYVRKSIDSTLHSIDWPYMGYRYVGRTYSVPNLFLEFSPSLSARPFIARNANELKTNYFVKVITKEGRVVGGRIQFVGSVPGKTEPYVGILLPPNMGETDGTFQGVQYFTCEKNCGLFVPFRKVVMAWKI